MTRRRKMNYQADNNDAQTGATVARLGTFYGVKMCSNLSTEDMFGEPIRLRKGKRGCVLQPGKSPGTYIIEFHIGRGMKGTDFTQVEVRGELLELEYSIGEPFKEDDWCKPQLWF